ncbi:hypothetical protein L7F22_048096 [Adiantum nelumboides]|nr:hypothetical protein [Adiantum nelumboides]
MDFDLNSSLFDEEQDGTQEGFSWSQMSQVLCSQPIPEAPSPPRHDQMRNISTNPTPTGNALPSPMPTPINNASQEEAHKEPTPKNIVLTRGKKKTNSEQTRRKKLAKGQAATNHSNWSSQEVRVLMEAIQQFSREQKESKGAARIISSEAKWTRVATYCNEKGVMRTALQCMDKWDNVFPKFKRIRDWDRAVPSGLSSWSQMDGDEREARGLPRCFDDTLYLLLEQHFSNDRSVDPGPNVIDSSSVTYGKLSSCFLFHCMKDHYYHFFTLELTLLNCRCMQDKCNPQATQGEGDGDGGNVEDPSSTGKKRASVPSKSAGIKREFQDISKNLMDSMDRSSKERMVEQKKQVQDLLAMQERQVKAVEDHVVVLENSMSKVSDLLGAYLARQG